MKNYVITHSKERFRSFLICSILFSIFSFQASADVGAVFTDKETDYQCVVTSEFPAEAEILMSPDVASKWRGTLSLPTVVKNQSKVYTVKGTGYKAFQGFGGITEVIIPEGYEYLDNSSFIDCVALKSITLPESLLRIGSSCFNRSALESFTLPASVVKVGTNAFRDCKNLTEFVFDSGNDIESLPDGMFNGCSSLASVTLPATVTSLGNFCFANTTSLKELTLLSTVPPKIITNPTYATFQQSSFPSGVLYVPESAVNAYKISDWGSVVAKIEAIKGNNPSQTVRISINKETLTIGKGQTSTLIATIEPQEAAEEGCVWHSSDENVATVDRNGIIKGISAGNAKITAKALAKPFPEAYCDVSVRDEASSEQQASISISKSSLTMFTGKVFQLTASVSPEDAAKKGVFWSSVNVNVASVNDSGLVTALSPGETVIYVQSYASPFPKAMCAVKVVDEATSIISISLGVDDIDIEEGGTYKFNVSVTPPEAASKGILWASGDKSIVEVLENATIKGVSEGETMITATLLEEPYPVAKCRVKVIPQSVQEPEYSLMLTPSDVSIEEGSIQKIIPVLTPAKDDARYIWNVEDSSVASVDSEGLIIGLSVGTTTVTVTLEGHPDVKAKVNITVSKHIDAAPVLTLNRTNAEMRKGESIPLSVSIYPLPSVSPEIIWSSSDVKVAVVDGDGNVTAVAEGSAMVKAIALMDDFPTAVCCVTVISDRQGRLILDHESVSIKVGDSICIGADISPDEIAASGIMWTSDNPTVASVDNEGNVTAISQGECVVTAQSIADPSVMATCRVYVLSASLPAVEPSLILSASVFRLFPGNEVTLTPEINGLAEDVNVIWSTTNASVASVDGKGNVIALSQGECNVIASVISPVTLTAVCTIIVVDYEQISPDPVFTDLEIRMPGSGVIRSRIQMGTPFEMDIDAETGKTLHSVIVNGQMTSQNVSSGKVYIENVESPVLIHLLIADDGNGVADFVSKDMISISGNRLILNGVSDGEYVSVYDLGGRLIRDAVINSDPVELSLETGETYVVCIGQHRFKVRM